MYSSTDWVANQRKFSSHEMKWKAMMVIIWSAFKLSEKEFKGKYLEDLPSPDGSIFKDKEEESESELTPVPLVEERLNVSNMRLSAGKPN